MNILDFLIYWVNNSCLELLGTFTGILCIYYEVKEQHLTWPAGIISSALYGVFLYRDQLYGQMLFQYITIPVSLWGWYMWLKRDSQTNETLHIQNLNKKGWLYLTILIILGSAAIYGIERQLSSTNFAFADAFSAWLGIIALFMLGKKLIEQWILWIIADGVPGIIMYQQKYYPSAILFACYTLMAGLGYYNWRQIKKTQYAPNPT